MKRSLFLVLLAVLLASSLFASGIPGKMGIDLTGGAVMLNPTAFDTDYKLVPTTIFPNTESGISSFVGMAPSGSAAFEFMMTPNFGLDLKGSFFFAQDEVSYTDADGNELFYNHAAFSIGYFGLGGKYYIGLDPESKFFMSLGADVGMFVNVQSFWEMEFGHDTPNPVLYTTDFTGAFFGANLEVGAKYFVSDNVAIGGNLGYRLANMTFAYPDAVPFNAVDADGNKMFKATSIDMSGITFGGGLSFYFGDAGKQAKGKGKKGAAAKGAASQYEKYGDYYFKAKKYSYAVKYFNGALKKDPKNAGLYKKIGFCYYYMKQPAYAKRYLAYYLRLNPNDEQIKAWVSRLK